jgi:hypothetical protein
MAKIKIYVSRKGKSDKIKLRDSEGNNPGSDKVTTLVDRGDTVIWMLDPKGSNLHSLNGVEKKPSSRVNLLKDHPKEQKDGSYEAKVKDKKKLKGKHESYYIKYKLTKDGTILCDDPRLKMRI